MQLKIFIGLVLTLVIAIFIPVYWATEAGRQDAARERLKTEAVERGAKLYGSTCAICHGPKGEGKIGPALQGTQLDENALEKTIARGIPGTVMPASGDDEGGSLRVHQIKDLITFIKNWDSTLLEELVAEEVTTPAPTSTSTPSATPMWTPIASLRDIRYDQNTPDTVLLSGERTFQSSCSVCHDLPTTQRIKDFTNDESLITFEIAMIELSELPLEQAEELIRYLLALRHGSDP